MKIELSRMQCTIFVWTISVSQEEIILVVIEEVNDRKWYFYDVFILEKKTKQAAMFLSEFMLNQWEKGRKEQNSTVHGQPSESLM